MTATARAFPDRSFLARPAFLAAVALLGLNDRLFKSWFPGLVTGKVSDFAGVLVVAVLLAVVLGRPAPALGLTAIGFIALKTVPVVAMLAAPVLGGVTRTDPSDLVALVALVPAAWWMRRAAPAGSAPVASVLGAVGAVLVLTATSCGTPTQVVGLGRDPTGAVVAEVASNFGTTHRFASSSDGSSWRSVGRMRPAGLAPAGMSACLDDGTCFRVVVGQRVESRSDLGPWRSAFSFSADQDRERDLEVDRCGDTVAMFRSLVVVGAAPMQRVVVAVGSDGVLVRTPDGRWHRRAVLGAHPVRLYGPLWFRVLGVGAFLVVGAALLAVGGLIRVRSGRWPRWSLGALIGAAVGLVPMLAVAVFADPTLVGVVTVGCVLVGAAGGAAVARTLRAKGDVAGSWTPTLVAPLGRPEPPGGGLPPGWFVDPVDPTRLRWFDGEEWTGWVTPPR